MEDEGFEANTEVYMTADYECTLPTVISSIVFLEYIVYRHHEAWQAGCEHKGIRYIEWYRDY